MKARTNPMGFTETTLLLPAHWACALINGDYDTIEGMEACVINHIEGLYGSCVDCTTDASFYKFHDATADGVLACDCLEFTFISHPTEKPI